jgi:hypothetical protein
MLWRGSLPALIYFGYRATGILVRYELRSSTLAIPNSFLLYRRLVLLESEYITTDIRYGTCPISFRRNIYTM